MTHYERPGIYTSYEVSSSIASSGVGSTVAVVAKAKQGTMGERISIGSLSQAKSVFGADAAITDMIYILLRNGAPAIRAVPLADTAVDDDYAAAFALLAEDEEVGVILCDSMSDAVHTALRDAILACPERAKHRIGIVERSGSVDTLCQSAQALNCERMVLVGPSGKNTSFGSVAAALAGQIAASSDPALPLNGVQLQGISDVKERFSDQDINQLVQAGVTPVECIGGVTTVIRGITTRSKTGDLVDPTWREITTIRIVDDVISTIRNALRSKFARAKNTVQTRGAIRTQVVIELENKKEREIVDSYGDITVVPNAEDPTICEVSFSFAVTHGLNQIHLSAHITV